MTESPKGPERTLDLESLKGLAHPLRVQLLDALSVHGPATASGLAERLGESSGATSYHLRQLARHGFVREVEGRGSGRERWWERSPGGIQLNPTQLERSPAAQAAARLVLNEWERNRSELLHDFLARGMQELPDVWIDSSTVSTANLWLTAEQLAEVVKRWMDFTDTELEKYRDQQHVPGARPVQVHFNAFPVLGGEPTPDPEPQEQS